uniref:Viral protein 7 n=1 Tax=Quaranjavirus quaranfilense TaxID=688436 RepID=A0A7T8IRR2_9ORTO|nr:viral protein 7 [Quaranjavirus quaranfilense]
MEKTTPVPFRRAMRCVTLNYTQTLHQLMALSGDIMRLLEKRDTGVSIETRVRVSAVRDAFYTDLLSISNCALLKTALKDFGNALISVMVARSTPTGSASRDPIQAILLKLVQVVEEVSSLPMCPHCSA